MKRIFILLLCALLLLAGCAPAAQTEQPAPEATAAPEKTAAPAEPAAEAPVPAAGADRYTYDKEVDLVVVGYGLSGAAAVIEAVDVAPDADILLLEKMPEAGGNSIAAG